MILKIIIIVVVLGLAVGGGIGLSKMLMPLGDGLSNFFSVLGEKSSLIISIVAWLIIAVILYFVFKRLYGDFFSTDGKTRTKNEVDYRKKLDDYRSKKAYKDQLKADRKAEREERKRERKIKQGKIKTLDNRTLGAFKGSSRNLKTDRKPKPVKVKMKKIKNKDGK